MRVKVGDTWYEAAPNQPICVEMTLEELEGFKETYSHPDPMKRYANFHHRDQEVLSQEAMFAWMDK